MNAMKPTLSLKIIFAWNSCRQSSDQHVQWGHHRSKNRIKCFQDLWVWILWYENDNKNCCKHCYMPRTRRQIFSTRIDIYSTTAWETGAGVDRSGLPTWGVGVPREKTDLVTERATHVNEGGAMLSTLWAHIRYMWFIMFSRSQYLPILASEFGQSLL